MASNWRSRQGLHDYLSTARIVGIEGLDTRALTRHLRESGAMRVGISTVESDPAKLLEKVKASAEMTGAKIVTGTHDLFGHSDVKLADDA
mgnify:CR=1 FL=1